MLLIRFSPDELFEPTGHVSVQLKRLLSGLSDLLHLEVSMRRHSDDSDRWMVYPVLLGNRLKNKQWTMNQGDHFPSEPMEQTIFVGRRTIRARRAAVDEFKPAQTVGSQIGSQIYLQLDVTSCAIRG